MSDDKRKTKTYFRHTKYKHFVLKSGLKGFLCTCNNREKYCIRESYNILNKYVDKLSETKNETELPPPPPPLPTTTDDIDEDFANEIKKLKSENATAVKQFQVVESGAKNFLFIKTTFDDPVKLVRTIVEDLDKTKKAQTKFLLRLIPIENTCKAYLPNIKAAFEPLLEKYFTDAPKTFSIVFNHRMNNSLVRDDVIRTIAEMISDKNNKHKVNLKEADLSVVIEIIKGIALIAVVPNFFKFKKYNLHSICCLKDDVKNTEEQIENEKEQIESVKEHVEAD